MSGWRSSMARASSPLAEAPNTAVRAAGTARLKRDCAHWRTSSTGVRLARQVVGTPLHQEGDHGTQPGVEEAARRRHSPLTADLEKAQVNVHLDLKLPANLPSSCDHRHLSPSPAPSDE